MTKFEEEFKALTSWDWINIDLIQQILTRFGNWHSDEEFQRLLEQNAELTQENNIVNQIDSQLAKENEDLKSKLQQQAVPECVGEFVSGNETKLSKADRIAYLLKSVQGDSYYLTDELPGDGTITVDEGQELYNWAICQHHETILKLWNGYTVEKPQLFYLREKNTNYYLNKSKNNGLELVPNPYFDEDNQFTQQEIDSMQTGSYELVPVEDGE